MSHYLIIHLQVGMLTPKCASIYVSPETLQVASLLNQIHKLGRGRGIATQEVKATYLHMHGSYILE